MQNFQGIIFVWTWSYSEIFKSGLVPLTILCSKLIDPVDTGRKLNVYKTFRRRPGRLLNALCTFSLRPVSTAKFSFLRFNHLRLILSLFNCYFPIKTFPIELFYLYWFCYLNYLNFDGWEAATGGLL